MLYDNTSLLTLYDNPKIGEIESERETQRDTVIPFGNLGISFFFLFLQTAEHGRKAKGTWGLGTWVQTAGNVVRMGKLHRT